MRNRVVTSCVVACLALLLLTVARAADPQVGGRVVSRLRGFEEVPAVATPGAGFFNGTIDGETTELTYELSYSNIEGNVTQAHLHYAQRGVNGGIMVFLCSNLGNGPAATQPCPPNNGTISGTITSANVLGVNGQSLGANDMLSLLRGIRGNVVYVNVHTDQLPGGSIRGQLRFTPDRPGVGGPPIDPNATFTRVQNEVFTPTCAQIGCHDTLGQQSQMILSSGRAYGQIVNVPSVEMPSLARIKPNDPANSYLYRKIAGAGITGDRMPQGLPPLSDAQISLIRDWIRRGAPND